MIGYISDSFFIVASNLIYDDLLTASTKSTTKDVKKAKINISLGELVGIIGDM